MNYFEFKKILDADPHSQDPDFLAAKNSDTRCYRAYQEAMRAEQIIQAALEIPVPHHNIQHIKFRQAQAKQNSRRNQWYAMAAAVMMAVGVGFFVLNHNPHAELEKFIAETLAFEPSVIMSDDEIPHAELEPLFASINTAIDGDLGDVHFMKLCPTLNGKGARMVFMNDYNEPITVLYMPNSPVEQAVDMQMNGLDGKIIALSQGSAAIIAKPNQSTALIENALINTLAPLN